MFTPPLGFHFRVEVLGITPVADDLRFTEVGGLALEIATEDMPEGGENRFVQRYPGVAKYGDLAVAVGGAAFALNALLRPVGHDSGALRVNPDRGGGAP